MSEVSKKTVTIFIRCPNMRLLIAYRNVRRMGPERAQYCTVVGCVWPTYARLLIDAIHPSLT
jgi:hypothetical protein